MDVFEAQKMNENISNFREMHKTTPVYTVVKKPFSKNWK